MWESLFDQARMVQLKCPNCGVQFAMDMQIYRLRQQDGEGFYCPNGHSLHFKENENSRLKNEIKNLNEHIRYLIKRNNELDEQVRRWKQKAAGYKGQWTRVKNQLEALRDGTKEDRDENAAVCGAESPQEEPAV